MITSITVDNFKSLKNFRVDLPRLAYFCGPNASGKTNFAEALDFLSNTFRGGLPYAVSEKAGFYNICFRKHRRARGAISFTILGEVSEQIPPFPDVTYEIEFSIRAEGDTIRSDFFVERERYSFRFMYSMATPFRTTIERAGETYKFTLPEGLPTDAKSYMPWLEQGLDMIPKFLIPRRTELIYPSALAGLFPAPYSLFEPQGLRVFGFNPRTTRQAGTPSVSGELGKHGENLPSALDRLKLSEPASFDRLQDWVQEVLPNLSKLSTAYTETKQLGLFVQEEGFGSPWYVEDLSDGTVMCVALFLALLDERHKLVMIEEPENSLHPWILRGFLDACEEMSKEKQILITTQSPLVVARASPQNLFLIERNGGYTSATRAIDRDTSLSAVIDKRYLDLGEYWLSGGMGAVPSPPEADSANLFTEEE